MMLKDIPLESTPPETGMLIYAKVREITGVLDPYKEIKRESTEDALAMYPLMKNIIARSKDNLLTGIRMAIAGNIIDLGVNQHINIRAEIDQVLKQEFAIYDYDQFKGYLNKVDEILYLGDNAGEAVFDRILIEEMKKPVIYVAREIPVVNDVTYEDAVQAGIEKVARIISSGTSAQGLF